MSAPKNRRARTAQFGIAGIAALCLVIAASVASFADPAPHPQGESANPIPTEEFNDYPWSGAEYDGLSYAQAWIDMNHALQTQDRDLFLSHAEGAALEQLGLWWDNMAAIGFTTGYIDPDGYETVTQVSIGVDLGFPANPLRGSGQVDAGLIVPLGQHYTVTTEVTGEDVTITSFVQAGPPMPWDDGRLYVQKREHVIVYGLEDERALVDETVEIAEKAAATLLALATSVGSEVPQQGFISAVTARDERLQRWYDTTAGLTEIGGFARRARQPNLSTAMMDPRIAAGGRTGGSTVVIGPGAGPEYGSTFIHEFAHSLHFNASQSSFMRNAAAPYEGFARFVEWTTGYHDFVASAELKQLVRDRGMEALSDEVVYNSETAHLGYAAAGSYYLFVAESGGDAWGFAVAALEPRNFTLDLAAESLDPRFSAANWIAWLEQR